MVATHVQPAILAALRRVALLVELPAIRAQLKIPVPQLPAATLALRAILAPLTSLTGKRAAK